jgi:hypothetical protein
MAEENERRPAVERAGMDAGDDGPLAGVSIDLDA